MTLRTTAIIAGVLGLLMLIAGLVANDARPDREVVTSAALDTPVVVVGPEVLALEGLTRVSIESEGAVEAHGARAVDASAWLKQHSATYVAGYSGWDALVTRTETRVVLDSESTSPSPSAGASEGAAAPDTAAPDTAAGGEAATATASPAATDAASTEEEVVVVDYGSTDDWRSTWRGVNRVSVAVTAVPIGETFVAYSEDGSTLTSVQFTAIRQVNDGWIDPLTWIGAALAALGIVAFLSGLIDTRPLQARVESWSSRRSKAPASTGIRPGSRRERRLAGSTLPPVQLAEPFADVRPEGPLLTTHTWNVDMPAGATTEGTTKEEGGVL